MRQPKAEIATSEAQLQRDVIDLAHVLGYRVAHFRSVKVQRSDGSYAYRTPVQADGAGWLDLIIAGHNRVLFRELKSRRGRLEPAQELWINDLRAAGLDVGVWKPRDWQDGTIERELRQKPPGRTLAPSPTDAEISS